MSLPMTAVGPLNVETKPILMVSAAKAGFASASAVTPASQNAVLIFVSLLIIYFIPPDKRTAPRQARAVRRCRAPPLEARYFVREIAGQQQARTARSPLEPSAHALMVMHHSSWWTR